MCHPHRAELCARIQSLRTLSGRIKAVQQKRRPGAVVNHCLSCLTNGQIGALALRRHIEAASHCLLIPTIAIAAALRSLRIELVVRLMATLRISLVSRKFWLVEASPFSLMMRLLHRLGGGWRLCWPLTVESFCCQMARRYWQCCWAKYGPELAQDDSLKVAPCALRIILAIHFSKVGAHEGNNKLLLRHNNKVTAHQAEGE
mmetsp:Transcript_59200/g.117596  ORF Transcript_59200/g.117596 Transcript_59200/m.117596 type:complete len:202 (-) Transcript_59200:875-1480(-)